MPVIDQPAGAGKPPWLASYPKGIDWSAEIPVEPLTAALDRAAERSGARPCVDFLGRTYSYAEIAKLVAHAAKGFQALGVKKGTRVGLLLPNSPTYVIAFHAVLKLGGIVVNFNPLYAVEEVCRQVADSQTTVMVTLDLKLLLPKVQAALERTHLQHVVVASMSEILPPLKGVLFRLFKRADVAAVPDDPRYVSYRRLIANDGRYAPAAIDPARDIAVLQYTGGTTGVPKGAMLSHRNLTANCAQVSNWYPGLEQERERILGVLPLFHVFAMTVVMNLAVRAAGCMILLPRFEIEQLLGTAAKQRPTIFPVVPTLLNALNRHAAIDRYDLSSLKFCLSGGASLPIEVKRGFEDRTGCLVIEGYGLSEASPVCTCNPVGDVYREGSIGLPLQGTTIEIRDPIEPDRLMPVDEPGEVCVRGPQVMAGYWDRPDESAATVRDGTLHTGDIGYTDAEGYTYVIDRMKEVILTNGYNVYPRVIEEAIYRHDAVAECAVVGLPDEERGQSAMAFIVQKPGQEVSAEAIRDFLRDKISPIEMPRQVEFRDSLPKTMIGKILKKELVAEEMAKIGVKEPLR